MQVSNVLEGQEKELTAGEVALTLLMFTRSLPHWKLMREFFESDLSKAPSIHIRGLNILKTMDWDFGPVQIVVYELVDYNYSVSPNWREIYYFLRRGRDWTRAVIRDAGVFTELRINERIREDIKHELRTILEGTGFDINHEPRNLYLPDDCPYCRNLAIKFWSGLSCAKHSCLLSYKTGSGMIGYFKDTIDRVPVTVMIRPSRANLLAIETERKLFLFSAKHKKWFTYPLEWVEDVK